MALSDRLLQNTPTSLPGNLNKAELFALARAKNKKEQEDLNAILPGNLNRAELDQLQGSEPGTGMSSEFRELIDRLIAMGVPKAEVLKIIQSRMDAMTTSPGNLNRTEMEMLNNSAPVSRFNQGGIVSLRHLTRPLGI